jgi:hypothetical protein
VVEDVREEVARGARRGEAQISGDWRMTWQWWFLRAEGAAHRDGGAMAPKRWGSMGWLRHEMTARRTGTCSSTSPTPPTSTRRRRSSGTGCSGGLGMALAQRR